jgi:hypothetical protein
MKCEQPVFIIGNPRSGTTLLRLAVTSHSNVCIPPEAGFLCWFSAAYGAWTQSDWANQNKTKNFLEAVATSKKFVTWGLSNSDLLDAFIMEPPVNYSSACSIIYNEYRKKKKPSASIWGDKNNFYINHIELINELYPAARFIHILRDPRDVACSYIELSRLKSKSIYRPNLPNDPVEIANQWLQNNTSASRSLSRLSKSQKLRIRYEDLALDPQKNLSTICSFLGLDFEDGMLESHLHNRINHLEPSETLDWKKRTLSPITSSQIGRYKVDLSSEQINAIEKIAIGYMEKSGYNIHKTR